MLLLFLFFSGSCTDEKTCDSVDVIHPGGSIDVSAAVDEDEIHEELNVPTNVEPEPEMPPDSDCDAHPSGSSIAVSPPNFIWIVSENDCHERVSF